MTSNETMKRLRDARPSTPESRDHSALFAEIVATPGDARISGSAPKRSRAFAWKRPRVLAGGSLGLMGVAAGLVLAIGGTATTAPAFAVVRQANGDVLVVVNSTRGVVPADLKLLHMGIREQVNFSTAPGPATSGAAVACMSVAGPGTGFNTPTGYQAAKPSGPAVKMRLGTDNTEVIPAGETGAGTVHLSSCVYYPYGPGTQLGNSGQKFLDANGG